MSRKESLQREKKSKKEIVSPPFVDMYLLRDFLKHAKVVKGQGVLSLPRGKTYQDK